MADALVAYNGWNSASQSWGSGGWGQNTPLVASTASVGTAEASLKFEFFATGFEITAGVSGVSVWADINPTPNNNWTATTPSTGNSWTATTPNAGNTWTNIIAA